MKNDLKKRFLKKFLFKYFKKLRNFRNFQLFKILIKNNKDKNKTIL